MSNTNREIYEYAKTLGVGDIRFANAKGSIPATDENAVSLNSLLEGAKALIVLFADYLPSSEAARGNMALSPYYVASNFAYHAAKRLANFLEESGARAVRLTSISARAAALRTGGFIGDNGFYYHDRFGSFTCIQTILTDGAQPGEYKKAEKTCLHCGNCIKGCPSNAAGKLDRCVRQYMDGAIPEALRGYVFQLFGCEKCQTACPLNSKERSAPHEFSLESLLCGECSGIKELAGPNMARPRRVVSQAALYAANSNAYHLAGKLKELSQTAEEPVRSHALWAYNKLGERNDNA